MYCVPIATLNQNKRSRLLYLGDTQTITDKSCKCQMQQASKGYGEYGQNVVGSMGGGDGKLLWHRLVDVYL